MLLSLERLRLEVRRSRTLVKTTLMFLGFFGIFVVIVFTVIFYAQKVTSRAGDIDVLRWVFFGSSAVTLLFSIACFLTFRFYLSAQAESAWLRSHEAAFSLRMLALEEKKTELRVARDALEERAFELGRISGFKSDFIANVSHELRTPLNSVILLAGLLTRNRQGNLSGEQIRHLGTMDRSARELLGLVDDILDLSRIGAGRLDLHFQDARMTSLLQIWEEFGAAQANRAGVTFELSLADNLPSVLFTDEMRLGQAVRNFLANAFQSTPKGGRVTLEVKRALQEASTRLKGAPWPALTFTVRDNGPGIPQQRLDTIFGAFNPVDTRVAQPFEGTGLGLAIACHLARLLGGTLEVDSVEGTGSAITLRVPIRTGTRVGVEEDVFRKASGTALRVLVVDDCPHVGGFVLLLAAKAGADAVHLENSSEALAALLERQEPFDVVITDLNMPGLGGDGLLSSLRSKDLSLPVFVLTAETDPAIHARLRALGFEDVLVKPLSLDTLSRALHSVRERVLPASENSVRQ